MLMSSIAPPAFSCPCVLADKDSFDCTVSGRQYSQSYTEMSVLLSLLAFVMFSAAAPADELTPELTHVLAQVAPTLCKRHGISPL